MEIKYFGYSSFRVQENGIVFLTQPFSKETTGTLFPKTKADFVLKAQGTVGESQERIFPNERKEVYWVEGPGEYELNGVELEGFNGGYWVKIKQIEVLYLWDWNDKILRKASDKYSVDILLLRGGDKGTDFDKKIKTALNKLSPSIVIPFYGQKESGQSMRLDWAKRFLDTVDREDAKGVDRVLIKKEDLSEEELKVVLLKSVGN